MRYCLAVDIGASSGRHMLAHMEQGKMILEEIHRFPNGMKYREGCMVWDIDELFREILFGMRKCLKLGKIPQSIGIDTWGVDYVLLDQEGERMGEAIAYRDSRTTGMDQEVYEKIPEEVLYEKTGIQKQLFNTVYQLMAEKVQTPKRLEKASTMLMLPDYFHYLLTGTAVSEYTNATTTQLMDSVICDWNWEVIGALEFPRKLFRKITAPGTTLGNLKPEIQEEVGYNCQVILPATHDTASAVMAVPAGQEEMLYISSGTWSLIGTEQNAANCSKDSEAHNLTNEGGYDHRFRYLKSIMGLWMIQSVRKELCPDMSYGDLCELASGCEISSIVDCMDHRFLAPENMTREVQKACEESGQPIPSEIGELASVIYHSLAACYARAKEEIENLTGVTYQMIHIVGGGANADYLNRLTAQACQCRVLAGPTEATAIGNLASQFIALGELENLKDARECIRRSFTIKKYSGMDSK